MDEREFFTEKNESHPHKLNCPSCKEAAEYQMRSIKPTKKASLPPRANDEDRARFKNEITSLQSVVLL